MKKSSCFLFYFLIFYPVLFAQNKIKYVNENIKTDSLNIPVLKTTYYFPISMFDNTSRRNLKLSKYLDNWYSQMLYNFKEPLLYNKIDEKEVYRFLWLRRFGKPVCVRIEKIGNSIKLYLNISDGMGGSFPGKVIYQEVKNITAEQWFFFISKIEHIHFWKMSVEEYKELEKDNSEWILEGSTQKKYHFITRTSPYEHNLKFFRECCEYLLSLSNFSHLR